MMFAFEKSGNFKATKSAINLLAEFSTVIKSAQFANIFPRPSKLKKISQSSNKLLFHSSSLLFSIMNGYDSLEVTSSESAVIITYKIIFKKWALIRLFLFLSLTLIVGFLLLSHLFSIYLFPNFDYPSNFEIILYIIPMIIFWGFIWPLLLIRRHSKILEKRLILLLQKISFNQTGPIDKYYLSSYGVAKYQLIRRQLSYLLLFLSCIIIGYLIHRRIRLGPAQFGYSFSSAQPDWQLPRNHFSSPGINITTETIYDFPRFLGKKGDCAVENVKLNPDWKKYPPKLIWHQPIGAGWSAFSIVNGFAVTMEQRGPKEQVSCYAVNSGKQHWRTGWNSRFFLFGDGPRSTPLINSGKVFALGAQGEFVAIDGKTGSIIWQKNIPKILNINSQQKNKELIFGYSNSPIAINNMVVIPGGGIEGNYSSLVAFDQESGKLCWKGGNQQISYSSPVVAVLCGARQILIENEKSVTGHDPLTGRQLWSYSWPGKSNTDANVSQVVSVGQNRLLLTKGYRVGAVLLELYTETNSNEYKIKEIWRNRDVLKTKFTNVVIWQNHIYGISDTRLECVELETGKRCWKKGRYGYGQILRVSDLLLVQSEYGKIFLIKLDPDKPNNILGSFQAIQGKTWNNIALYGRFLLVRNGTEAACYELPILPIQ